MDEQQAPTTSASAAVPPPLGASDQQMMAVDDGPNISAFAFSERPPSAKSPNFNFLMVGNEAEKLKWLVLQHVKPSALKRMFAPLRPKRSKSGTCSDELAVAEQACTLLSVLEPTDKSKQPVELEQACYGLIGLLTTEKIHLRALDRVITRIIKTACEKKIISLLLACQLMVTSIDFRSKTATHEEKIEFVRKSMDQLDYKNMRDLLKLLLVEKLDKMECRLDEYHHEKLYAIEELVVDLIDRRKNYCPALFFITEISRIDTEHSSIHFLPRVSLKIREMVASFRPLAEIGSMLGRSWMWPVPASSMFSWSSQTWSAWKLDEKQAKLYFKTHLPYSSENSSPQTYFQYILFKQPHGQDNLNYIMRSSGSQSSVSRLQCDEVIQLLILEAMCAMEDSEEPVLAPVNQYNWLHLSHLVTYALSIGHCTLSQLLMMLLPQLRSCQYQRAKEELMWILLQYIAHAISYAKEQHQKKQQQQKQQQQQSGGPALVPQTMSTNDGLGSQNRELILEIFNVLYTDKSMNWGDTCSTEQPLNMVRFFAPAAIWVNLVSSAVGHVQMDSGFPAQPQPPEKLRTLIEFIEKQLLDNKEQKQLEKNSALLAVVANAYSNSTEVFEKNVISTVFRMLGLGQQQNQQQQPEKWWTLPGGRKTDPYLRALELTFLDSLTFHAKRQLYTYFFVINLQTFPSNYANWKTPTPALAESMVRLFLSTELIDPNGYNFYKFLCRLLKNSQQTEQYGLVRNDLLAMLLEMLNFRLQNIGFGWKWSIEIRINFLALLLESLTTSSFSHTPQSSAIQICSLLEHTVLRFTQCTWPHDQLTTFMGLLANSLNPLTNGGNNTNSLLQHALKYLQSIPELYRAFLLTVLRATKLLGDNQLQLCAADLDRDRRGWPQSELRWFPPSAQLALFPNGLDKEEHHFQSLQQQRTQAMHELEKLSRQEMQFLLQLDADYDYFGVGQQSASSNPSFLHRTLLVSIFHCLYQFGNLYSAQQIGAKNQAFPNVPALCYKLLGQLGNRDLQKLSNALVDWLCWTQQQQQQSATAQIQMPEESVQYDTHRVLAVLNDMLFLHQFITVERFLLSLALHPADDCSIRAALCLLAGLLDKFPALTERLHACYAFTSAHSQMTSANSEDFFVQMAEFYKKFPENSYVELYRRSLSQQLPPEQQRESQNLPIYYGHLAERINPIVDIIVQRALEVEVKPTILDTLLRYLSPIYRLHPQPMSFIYKTLYSLDGFLDQQQEGMNPLNRPVRRFVLEIVLKLDQEDAVSHFSCPQRGAQQNSQGRLLTMEFIQQDHNMNPVKFCRLLVERIVQASTYTHQPPSFVHKDWRFAEYSPSAQALTSAWVELLASRHSPDKIIEALVQLALRRPISRPQDTLNALGLLLSGLPASFQASFLDQIEQSFDLPQLASPDADPAQLFESLSHEVYLHTESKVLSMLALIHSFCQHGGNNSLNIIPELIVQRLAPKVQNEAQLLYFLRIVVPYLQRIHEKERSRHMTEIVAIYKVLSNLTQKVGRLRYEDTICDLLYQFKYMFVGYLLKEQTEQAIRSFPDSMREKLKFLLTHSSNAAATESQQQLQQMLQQQQQQQLVPGSVASVHPPVAGMMSAGQPQPLFGGQQQHFPSNFPSMMHSQQQLPFSAIPFDPSLSAAGGQGQPPALLVGMLQKRQFSRESEGSQPQQIGGGPVPPMGTAVGGQQSVMMPTNLFSATTSVGPSTMISPGQQFSTLGHQQNLPSSSALQQASPASRGGGNPQQLPPPPPYPQQFGHVPVAGSSGPVQQMTSAGGQMLPVGKIPFSSPMMSSASAHSGPNPSHPSSMAMAAVTGQQQHHFAPTAAQMMHLAQQQHGYGPQPIPGAQMGGGFIQTQMPTSQMTIRPPQGGQPHFGHFPTTGQQQGGFH